MAEETVVKDVDHFMQNPDEFEALSVEDQARVFSGETIQGETKSEASPDLTEKKDEEPVKVEPKADDPVVQAKDGKNIIPFSELEAAREKAARFEQMAQDQAALIADLKAAQEQDAKTGGTEAQEAVMAEYTGEYPELMEDMKPFLEQMLAGEVRKQVGEALAGINKDLQPIKESAEEAASKAHFDFISTAHPDSEEIAASPEFAAWIESKPAFVREHYHLTASKGTAEQVVELLDEYRKDNPKASGKVDLAGKVDAVLAGIEKTPPSSLSDVPGASAAHHDEAEAIREMSSMAVTAKFMSMSPDKINETMDRLI